MHKKAAVFRGIEEICMQNAKLELVLPVSKKTKLHAIQNNYIFQATRGLS